MFGYITVFEPELKVKDFKKYKSYYCGLCHTLKKRHGFLGQMTLTYDMTFAIILLTSLYEVESEQLSCRCKVHPVKKQGMLVNEMTEYAADMNIILAYYHMKDNWVDEGRVSGFAGTYALHRKVKHLIKKYPRQSKAICKSLKELSACEREEASDLDTPAGCFGRLMAELLVYRKDHWEPRLRNMGFFLGKFIYIMDAYEDVEKDREKGCYNPLKHLADSGGYEERCRNILQMMIAECSAEFERLPCLFDVDILRNILYDGVWNQYKKIQRQKKEAKEE